MNKHKRLKQESNRLGDSITKETVSFKLNGTSPMLVHKPCYNGEITQESVTGIVQTRKDGGSNSNKSDHPSNFYYQCECCGETFPYQ